MATRKLTRARCPSPRQVDDHAATELELYIRNDPRLRTATTTVFSNLARKKKRGVYDSSLAPQAFTWVTAQGAKAYAREFDAPSRWNRIFPKRERDAVACDLADDFEVEYKAGTLGQHGEQGFGFLAWLGVGVAIAGLLYLVGSGARKVVP